MFVLRRAVAVSAGCQCPFIRRRITMNAEALAVTFRSTVGKRE
jgi:hypothetical protein